MKKLFLFLGVWLLCVACLKEEEFRKPKAITIGAEVAENGILRLVGRSEGGTYDQASIRGFCYSYHARPNIKTSQVLSSGGDGEFSALLPFSSIGDTLYYRAMAASNMGGIDLGEVFEIILPKHSVPEVPCAIPANTLRWFNEDIGTTDEQIYFAGARASLATFGEIGLVLNTFSPGLDVILDMNTRKVEQGVYRTVGMDALRNQKDSSFIAQVRIKGPWDSYNVENGQEIYITELPNGARRIEFCELRFEYFNTINTISAQADF